MPVDKRNRVAGLKIHVDAQIISVIRQSEGGAVLNWRKEQPVCICSEEM